MFLNRFMRFLYDWNSRMMDNKNAQAKYYIRGLK